MIPSLRSTFAVAIPILFASRLADDPFTGTWHIDQAKSHFAGPRTTIANAGKDSWRFTYGAMSWTLKTDGSDASTPFGVTQSLRVSSPTDWLITSTVNGKVVAVDRYSLSADGKSLLDVTEGTRETGEHFSDTARLKRVSGKSGFDGTWQTEAVKLSVPEAMTVSGSDAGISFDIPAEGMHVACTFDGKQNVVQGPRVVADAKASCKKTGARSVRWDVKVKDRLLSTYTWSVSPDGKTLTSTERDAGVPEPIIAVYERG